MEAKSLLYGPCMAENSDAKSLGHMGDPITNTHVPAVTYVWFLNRDQSSTM